LFGSQPATGYTAAQHEGVLLFALAIGLLIPVFLLVKPVELEQLFVVFRKTVIAVSETLGYGAAQAFRFFFDKLDF